MKYFTTALFLIIAVFHQQVVAKEHTVSADKRAMAIADASVNAIGGRENYNNTRYLSWVFFGKRFHVWDKYTGDIRIEYGKGDLLLMNVHTKQGRVWENGQEIIDKAQLKKKLDWGYKVWINDSYWVVMPFKLHDDGVNLAYTREDMSLDGRPVDVLTMTFNDVGVTPENKYEVFFDKETKRFSEFAYYPTIDTKEPRFRMPWKNWKTHGNIMLSDDRGEAGMAPINIFMTLPATIFTSQQPAKTPSGKIIEGAIIK